MLTEYVNKNRYLDHSVSKISHVLFVTSYLIYILILSLNLCLDVQGCLSLHFFEQNSV
jgi:hypothetical protein